MNTLPTTSAPHRPGHAPLILLLALLAGCSGSNDPVSSSNSVPPLAFAEIEVLDNHSTNPDPASDATCQTGALVRFKAHNAEGHSVDPLGQELTYEWLDEVDQGNGRELSLDFGPGNNPLVTDRPEIGVNLSTIAAHYVTLTARTRDGREASQTLRVTVTACENCGTPE